MVESNVHIDALFAALSDSTRRDILSRVARTEMSIGAIAEHYQLTLAAISKHIKVLEKAHLVVKRRRGKQQVVTIVPDSITLAQKHIDQYAQIWSERFDRLDTLLNQGDTI